MVWCHNLCKFGVPIPGPRCRGDLLQVDKWGASGGAIFFVVRMSENQKNSRVRKIFVRNSGAGNGCVNFMDAWKNALFLQEKPMSIKFLVLGGGGILGFGGGGGADYIFMGAWIFLRKPRYSECFYTPNQCQFLVHFCRRSPVHIPDANSVIKCEPGLNPARVDLKVTLSSFATRLEVKLSCRRAGNKPLQKLGFGGLGFPFMMGWVCGGPLKIGLSMFIKMWYSRTLWNWISTYFDCTR